MSPLMKIVAAREARATPTPLRRRSDRPHADLLAYIDQAEQVLRAAWIEAERGGDAARVRRLMGEAVQALQLGVKP